MAIDTQTIINAIDLDQQETIETLVQQDKNILTHFYEVESRLFLPLHYAIQKEKLELVELLISLNAKVNQKDKAGWTALHHAATTDNVEITNFLIQKNAEKDSFTGEKETPLALAKKYGCTNVENYLSQLTKEALQNTPSP